MSKIYYNSEVGQFFKMLKPVGSSSIPGFGHYALWVRVKRFLCFWKVTGRVFYLDMYGFEKVK